ncbi:MAG TPA: hemerythrin domain-containing protein [Thermoplasmata archaeon]|nr:hemerythrin domain-containing protein [Thermoplasmata archaeon]
MTSQPQSARPRSSTSVYEAASRTDPFGVLLAEHALLRQAFARLFIAAAEDADPLSVRRGLEALSDSLRLHQRREDAVLYPVCERLFGGKGGAASVLRCDHATIQDQLGVLARQLDVAGRVSSVRLDALRHAMDDHFGKEERVLFPLTAALLSGAESSDLERRLRAPPPNPREG